MPSDAHDAHADDPHEAAPGDLELVASFVNTLHRSVDAGEPDVEQLASPQALRSWMDEHGIDSGDELRAADLNSAIEFREALRMLLWANNGAELDQDALRALRSAAERGLIRVEIDPRGRAVPRPAEAGLGALFARLLAAVADSQAAGTWERIKACAAEDCQWAFYDESRNRSRTWCTMEVCGNRAKTRSYRARRTRADRR
jgi:predicted RNA-binding Zn ribbon-like protein